MERLCCIGPDITCAVSRETLDAVGLPALLLYSDGRVAFENQTWRQEIGECESGPWSWLDSVVEDQRAHVRRVVEAAVEQCRSVEIELTLRRSDGSPFALDCILSVVEPTPGAGKGALLVGLDVTERREQERRLAFMAGHDPLTGLANRRAFDEAVDRAVTRAKRGAHSVLLMLDMDHLKAFNDEHGHLAGDQALINLGLLLRAHVRATDLPARVGGDEFAVLLEDTTIDDALEIAERMREAVSAEEFVAGARELGLGISGGLVAIEEGVPPLLLMDRADAALYVAKCGGRNRMCVWDDSISDSRASEDLSKQIRRALASDGFYLVFQPVMGLADGHVEYFESLVRMRCEDGCVRTAQEFISLVERLGVMGRLTRRVVEDAVGALGEVAAASVSVNLSASDLGDSATLDAVAAIIERAGPPCARRLIFEVRESALLGNPAGGRMWMERLTPMGCRFVLDDFGSGAGIFVLLSEPHIRMVKLSLTIIKALSTEDLSQALVRALRELVESQGKLAVATYLGSAALLGDAIRAGFELGQGYGLQEPLADLAGLWRKVNARSR